MNTTEQYLDVSEKRSVLEVLAGPELTSPTPGVKPVASLVLFPAKGGGYAEMGERPSTEYVFAETFERDNPTLSAAGHVNIHLNRAQAIELACTLLNAADVEYDLLDDADLDEPADDVFRSY